MLRSTQNGQIQFDSHSAANTRLHLPLEIMFLSSFQQLCFGLALDWFVILSLCPFRDFMATLFWCMMEPGDRPEPRSYGILGHCFHSNGTFCINIAMEPARQQTNDFVTDDNGGF